MAKDLLVEGAKEIVIHPLSTEVRRKDILDVANPALEAVLGLEDNPDSWGDTGKAIVNNWLGLVYQLTNLDRKLQFMPGVDPDDPLGLNK